MEETKTTEERTFVQGTDGSDEEEIDLPVIITNTHSEEISDRDSKDNYSTDEMLKEKESWEDVDPPPGSSDSSSEDVEKSGERRTTPAGASETKRTSVVELISRVDVALQMGLSAEEIPLLGYFVASCVFLFAAISRRPGQSDIRSFRRQLQPYGDDLFDNFLDMDVLFDEIMGEMQDEIYSACSLGGGLPLSRGPFIYAIFLGVFGMLFSGLLIGWLRWNEHARKKLQEEEGQTEDDLPNSQIFLEKYRHLFDFLLFTWAIIGWGFFTFSGASGIGYTSSAVFGYTGNGYFALWGMLLFSLSNRGVTLETLFREIQEADSCVYALTLSSLVLMIELVVGIPSGFWSYRTYKRIAEYSLAVSVITIVYGLITAVFSKLTSNNFRFDSKIRLGCLLVLFLLWIFVACLTTFVGPFLTTGNGYFAAWTGLILVSLAILDTIKEISETYI